MRPIILLLMISLFNGFGFFAPPGNDEIRQAVKLEQIIGYCSEDQAYSNADATASGYRKGSLWLTEGKDIWYKFTASRSDISITVSGKQDAASTNTLTDPLIAIYAFNGTILTEMIGSMTSLNHVTKAYKGGLTVGNEYYIRISAENNATGTFKLCINSYNPPAKPGQDCATASILCNKETFSEVSISGTGNSNKESAGTCMGSEVNSAWYKWTAANDGTLTFVIMPTSPTDDIDWVLYDLGPNGDCTNLIAANAIRCAAGNGVSCIPRYSATGLHMSSTDLFEQANCPPGQDGFVKYVDMVSGHNYALLIDNFSSGNNGFTVSFGGTGDFRGPKTDISVTKEFLCTPQQRYTLSAGTGTYSSLKWSFGEGASTANVNTPGPHQITYATNGQKNITLEATNALGCAVITYYNLLVADPPQKPLAGAVKTALCPGDLLSLTAPVIKNAIYRWTGPNLFSSAEQNPVLPITGPENGGDYSLVVQVGDCESEPAVVHIPPIPEKVTADFSTSPDLTSKYAAPASIRFTNTSLNAGSFSWNFGDGQFSSETNPVHVYTTEGTYSISLTAYTINNCFATQVKGELVILKGGTLFIPGSFSPNGDGINDEFQVSIANLKSYQLTIISRWGTKIFESASILNGWNGKHKDQDVPAGVYYYLLTAKDTNNRNLRHSGSIVLIR